MVLGSTGVRPPHRMTARLVVASALSVDEKFEAMLNLASALAPHIDRNSIRRLTLPYRIIRRVMDEETVMRLIGPKHGRSFYEHIEDAYRWNGRYWDQRALFESSLDYHDLARSHAEYSLQIHWHPFALNTLGTVLGRIAIATGDADTLREATEYLQRSRDRDQWEASEHPYVTFFTTMIRFGEKWGRSAMPSRLRDSFDEWFRLALRAPMFARVSAGSQLQQYQADWLRLSLQPDP